VRLLAVLVVLSFVLSGCGGSSNKATATGATTNTVSDPAAAAGGGKTLYRGGDWAVVVDGSKAVALHLIGGEWQPDRTGRVKVELLGPKAIATPTPQVAAELTAPTQLVESGMWVDGVELVAKGGGLSPKRGTIYGAPSRPLSPGAHIAVAYARTAAAATAVARAFDVP
jgi:hypothetical protein